MNKKLNFKQLKALIVIVLMTVGGGVFAQNTSTSPDSVYYALFGCDSLSLTLQNVTTCYYADTVIQIDNKMPNESGEIVVYRRDFYQITIGHSYDVVDTVEARVCRNNLPYAFRNNFYTETGDYWTSASTVLGCDSSNTLLKLQVLDGQRDTFLLTMCHDESVIIYNDITFTSPGIYNLTIGSDADGCPIVQTYVVTQYPILYDTVTAVICQDQAPYVCRDQSFSATGEYTVEYTTATGCQGVTMLYLTVNPSSADARETRYATVCSTDLPYVYEGIPFYGSDYATIKNQYGCDSVLLTMVLTVITPEFDTVAITLCPEDFPYEYDSVNVFDAPGNYYIDLNPDSVCSQFTYLQLSLYPTVNDTVAVYTFDSSYTFHDSLFTESTIYTYTETNSYQCLDHHTLLLVLNHQLVYDTMEVTVCRNTLPYVWHGISFEDPGSYAITLQNIYGYDSAIVSMNFTVKENVSVTEAVTITRNDIPYLYHGEEYTESGVYQLQAFAATVDECDTFYTLNLTVEPVYNQTVDTTVCDNEAVIFLGDTVTTAGAHLYTFHYAGYDSVVTLNVNYNPTYHNPTIDVVIGEYELPYIFNDSVYYTAGYHEQILTSESGCDSVISFFLTINPAVINHDTIQRQVCSNDMPVNVFDSVLSEAGTYMYLVRTADGLYDSVFYVNLVVKQSPTIVLVDTAYLCAGGSVTLSAQSTGGSYLWNNGITDANNPVNVAGVYSVTVTNGFDCSASDTVQVIQVDLPNAQISGGNSVCEGGALVLRATGGDSYLWSTDATTDSIMVTPQVNTTYHVTVTNSYGCSQTQSQLVTVNSIPSLSVMGNNSICEGQTTTFIVSGANSYLWSTGASSDRITVNTEGFYMVTATDIHGCQNTATVTLAVHTPPTLKINGRTTICQGGNTLLTATGASSYEWSSGEVTQAITASLIGIYSVTGTDQYGCSATKSVTVTQSTVNATFDGERYFCHGESTTLGVVGDAGNSYQWFDGTTTNTITVTSPGLYSVTVTNAAGCQSVLSTTMSEYTVTIPTIIGTMTICEGQTTTLRASGGSSYVWDNGSTQALISVNATGTYTVTSTNQYGCTATNSATVLVNPLPTVNILSQNSICRGESVSLTAISSGSTYNWSSGENTASITVSPTSTTTYTVLVTDENGCTNTASHQVVVNQLPNIYVMGQNTICQGDTTELMALGGATFEWNTGQTTPTLQVSTPGTYTVTATSIHGCSSTTSVSVAMHLLPNVTFSGNTTTCAGTPTTITAAGANAYQWSNGATGSTLTTSTQGVYYVTATSIQGCVSHDSVSVTVNPNPVLQVTGDNYVCAGYFATLTASGATSYQWSNQSTEASISVSPSSTTSYTVTGYDANGCHASVTKVVTVEALPQVSILGNKTICAGQSTVLSAVGGISYNWTTGDTISEIVLSPSSTQTYVVSVTNTYGCVASAAATVTVNSLPEISFYGNMTICQGNTTTISAGGGSNYLWSTGAQTSSIVVGTSGMYGVTATNAQNCSATDSVYVKVNPNPQVQISGDDHVCSGSVITLTASGASTYSWNTGESSTAISISPAVSTDYYVVGTDTNGCSSTVHKMVNVEALPALQVVGGLTICQGETTVLTAIGGSSYMWSNGSATQSITVSPNYTTAYVVSATNSYGCSSTATATVTVNMLPSVIFNGNTSFCEGQSSTISVVGGNSYVWSTGATTNSITVSTPGVYSVSVSNSLNCQRTDSVNVVVWNNPVVTISGLGLICDGESTALTASGAATYVWSTGETSSAITVLPTETTTYNVIGYDANGCGSTVSKVVNVEALPEAQISGVLAICHGDTTTLTSSSANSYLWNNGATTQQINASTFGIYTVTVTSDNGCQASASVTVVDNPMPIFTLFGVSSICENTTEELSVTGDDNNYLWSTGSTDSEITISSGGVYSVTATNDYGCSQTSTIVVTQYAAPVLTIIGIDELCQGDSTQLVAATDASQFLWSTGETTQSIQVVPNNTTYTVSVTNENGCVSTAEHTIVTHPTYNMTVTGSICEHESFSQYGFDIPVMDTAGTYTFFQYLQTVAGCDSTVNLLLTVNPLPRMDTINGLQNITQYVNTYYSVNNPQFVENYEWRVSNTHWTLTNPTFSNVTLNVNNTNGTGVLTARGINGCGYTEVSLSIYCNVGIEDHPEQAVVKLYPNPVHQSLYIDLDNASDIAKVALYDESGRLVYKTDCSDTHLEIDCTRFANGHYTVQFLNEKGRRVESRKIVVKNK